MGFVTQFIIKCRTKNGTVTEVVKRPAEKSQARSLMTFFAESSLKTYKTDTDNRFSGVRLLHANGGLGLNPDRPEIYIRHDNDTLEYWHVEKLQEPEVAEEAKDKQPRRKPDDRRKNTTPNPSNDGGKSG